MHYAGLVISRARNVFQSIIQLSWSGSSKQRHSRACMKTGIAEQIRTGRTAGSVSKLVRLKIFHLLPGPMHIPETTSTLRLRFILIRHSLQAVMLRKSQRFIVGDELLKYK